jgi:hypothetical protein
MIDAIKLISSSSATASSSTTLIKPLISFGGIIASAFFGGLFAGVFTNYFESKRNISGKRAELYNGHRNTIVQIEHELIPTRINLSRNLSSINEALENINENSVRVLLRFYKLHLSTGLGIKILNVDLINKYAQLYSSFESINSDIEYITGIVTMIRENLKNRVVDESLLIVYKQMLAFLKRSCEEADRNSLNLLAYCQLIIGDDKDKIIKDKYIKDGISIKNILEVDNLTKKEAEIKNEEDPDSHEGEEKPKFISLFLDLKKS